MKKLLALFIIIFAVFACENEPKDYVTLSGKITNPHFDKTIKVFVNNFDI